MYNSQPSLKVCFVFVLYLRLIFIIHHSRLAGANACHSRESVRKVRICFLRHNYNQLSFSDLSSSPATLVVLPLLLLSSSRRSPLLRSLPIISEILLPLISLIVQLATMGLDNFAYDADHRVIVCRICQSCILPKEQSWSTHLRSKPHHMKGDELQRTIDHFSSYDLRTFDELRDRTARSWRKVTSCPPIQGLQTHDGYTCVCVKDKCNFSTLRELTIRSHVATHGMKASRHTSAAPLWRECKLQTYFASRSLIDYFEVQPVTLSRSINGLATQSTSTLPADEDQLFQALKADVEQASHDLNKKAEVVQGNMNSSSNGDQLPWLVQTGFPTHLHGLRDVEITSSYALPPRLENDHDDNGNGNRNGNDDDDDDDDDDENEDDGDVYVDIDDGSIEGDSHHIAVEEEAGGSADGDDTDLRRILAAAEKILWDAHKLCSDRSPDRKMTPHHAKRLGNFRGDVRGWRAGNEFRTFKKAATLQTYFRIWKQLLAYYYRVVYREDGHFTRDSGDQVLPRDVIETTSQQRQAMGDIISALRRQDQVMDSVSSGRAKKRPGKRGNSGEADGQRDDELKQAIRNFYVSLICQTIGVKPFRSPVLSFCAMRSRSKPLVLRTNNAENRNLRSTWREPANYNSDLSALIWTAQLVLFDFVCFAKQDDEDGISNLLDEMCERYFQQTTQTPFGYMLLWRMFIFKTVAGISIKHHARWSIDGETVDYKGIKLRINQVSELVLSEYQQAKAILYEDLLFGMLDETAPFNAAKLHDDLDGDHYGFSWLTDKRNDRKLAGTQDALLREIEKRAGLRQAFVRRSETDASIRLCPKAMAVYEAEVQEFLKRMLIAIHIGAGFPLQQSELLSVTWMNSEARRSVFVWEKKVLIHVRTNTKLDLSGVEKDHIRFLPSAIGALLLTYLAFVQPLRQVFLRQSQPGALLSPHLWSKLDGKVWDSGSLNAGLKRACIRARIPKVQTIWWRQVANSIVKEKFSASQQANFDNNDRERLEDEQGGGNHATHGARPTNYFLKSYHTSSSSAPWTVSSLLHRGYQASLCWHSLFSLDAVLQGKRPLVISIDDEE